jgi:hypothetical protein
MSAYQEIKNSTPDSGRGWTCTVVERDKASEGYQWN